MMARAAWEVVIRAHDHACIPWIDRRAEFDGAGMLTRQPEAYLRPEAYARLTFRDFVSFSSPKAKLPWLAKRVSSASTRRYSPDTASSISGSPRGAVALVRSTVLPLSERAPVASDFPSANMQVNPSITSTKRARADMPLTFNL